MRPIKRAMTEYLNSLAKAEGHEFAAQTRVRHAEGVDFVIEHPDGRKKLVDIEQLRLMSIYLRKGWVRKAA